ncbi:MAG: metal-dependent transcriptional regulator [Sphingobacteriales bacterium]|nr:MAG: metal-dependent transcriptional regulator [Sphingobacteriales bacterium]
MHSLTEENYLKALLLLSAETGAVSVNELSKRLGTKMPTVNGMVKRLAEKKLVRYESYQPLQLTEKGKKEAGLILRKHRLTEMYLVQQMGFGWEEVHDIAEQIEHVQSPRFFEKMDELLGYPTLDPHGSPIPDQNGRMEWRQYRHLSTCTAGEIVTLTGVTTSGDEFLRFLNSRELRLGLKLKIKSVESFDGSMVVSYEKHPNETLSTVVCERLLVDPA